MARTKDPELERRRRTQILATTRRLLEESSHATITLDRIAAEAGVSKGMLTYYFASKEQVITEAIAELLLEQETMLKAIARDDRPLHDRLALLVEAALPSRSALESELRMQAEVLSFAKQNPATLAAVRQLYRGFRHACESMIELGVQEGSVTAKNARDAYLIMHALIDGLSFQIFFDPTLDVADVRRRALEVIEGMLRKPALGARAASRSSRSAKPKPRR